MDTSLPQFIIAMPEIFLLCMACFILLVDVFLPERYRNVTYYLSQLTLIVTLRCWFRNLKNIPVPVITFSGNYVIDQLAVISKLFMYLFSFFAFAYAREYIKARKIARGEYYLLGLFAVLGMSIMASAYSLLTIYLGLELLSLSLYAMIAMYKESNLATEAAMKYFVLGALASGMMLYGISLLYGVTGDIQLDVVAKALQAKQNMVPTVALIFVLAGIAF